MRILCLIVLAACPALASPAAFEFDPHGPAEPLLVSDHNLKPLLAAEPERQRITEIVDDAFAAVVDDDLL